MMEKQTLQPNKEDAGRRIDAWLAETLEDMTRSAAQRLIEEGRVTCGGKVPAKGMIEADVNDGEEVSAHA